MNRRDKKFNWLKLVILSLVLGLSLIITPLQVSAQGEGEGEEETASTSADIINARQNADLEQTKLEMRKLMEFQEARDLGECEALNRSVNLADPSTDPYDQRNPYGLNSEENGPTSAVDACGDNMTAASYIAGNEGYRDATYVDSEGYPTIGWGHKITGNEPAGATLQELFNADYTSAVNCVKKMAGDKYEVDWDSLSENRQTVLIDMSYNLGCGGSRGIAGFERMWKAIKKAQEAGSGNDQADWNVAGQEIIDSTYCAQVGRRCRENAKAMSTDSEPSPTDSGVQSPCSGTMVWFKTSPFGSLLASVFGPIIAEAQAGTTQYVPVQEQQGELMDHASSTDRHASTTEAYVLEIDRYTEQIRNLDIQICTYLKALHRIQARNEQTSIENADVMRVKATELEKYRQAVFGDKGLIKNGYTTLDENGDPVEAGDGLPLYVTNQQNYLANASDEATRVAFDEIDQMNNSNMTDVLAGLQAEDSFGIESGPSVEDIQNVLNGGISNSETIAQNGQTRNLARGPLDGIPVISSLVKPFRNTLAWLTGKTTWAAPTETPVNQTIVADQFWNSFINVVEKNPGATYLKTAGYIEQKRNEAVQAARDTALQGQGFLPVRTCLAKTTDGKTCTLWGTQQPGIIVKESDAAAVNSRLSTYIQAKTKGELGKGNEPNIVEIITNNPAPGGGGAPGPGFASSTYVDTNDQSDLVMESSYYSSDVSTNMGSDFDVDVDAFIRMLRDLFGSGDDNDSVRPNITFRYESPTKAEIISGNKANQITVGWSSSNADKCYTTNDWWSKGSGTNSLIKKAGASLGNMGYLTIKYPLAINSVLKKSTGTATTTMSKTATTTGDNLTSSKVTYVFTADDVALGNSFLLTLDNSSISIPAVGSTVATVLLLKETASLNWPNYKFTSTLDKLIIAGKEPITLGIKCQNRTGTTTKSIDITRE